MRAQATPNSAFPSQTVFSTASADLLSALSELNFSPNFRGTFAAWPAPEGQLYRLRAAPYYRGTDLAKDNAAFVGLGTVNPL